MKTAVLTDTRCGLTRQEAENLGVYMLSLEIVYQNKTYQEEKDITYMQLQEILESGGFPTTASPNLYKIQQLLLQIRSAGYDHVIVIPLTLGISGTGQLIQSCAQELSLDITLIDCYTTCAIQKTCVLYAKNMLDQGMKSEDVILQLQKLIVKSDSYIVPDDMEHLKKGGRITPLAAALAGMLKIRPILKMNESIKGVIDVYKKVRTQKAAMKTCVEAALQSGMNSHSKLYVLYSKDRDLAEQMIEIIHQKLPDQEVEIVPFSAVITVHLGLSCVALQYMDIPK